MSTTFKKPEKKKSSKGEHESVRESLTSPVVVGSEVQANQDILIAGTSNNKSPRIENSTLESLRASLKDKITSRNKGLLVESQKEMLKLPRPKQMETLEKNQKMS